MADGFFGRLAPVLQGVGGSLLAGGNLDQAGPLIAQAQAAQGQQQLRALQTRQVEAQLAAQQRKQAREAETRAAFEALPPAMFGAGPGGEALRTAAASDLPTMRALLAQRAKAMFPTGQTKTTLQRNLEAAGLSPGTPEFQQAAMAAVTKPATRIDLAGQTAEQKALGGVLAKRFERFSEAGDTADATIANNEILRPLINVVQQGRFESARVTASEALRGIGVSPETVSRLGLPADTSLQNLFDARSANARLNVLSAFKGNQTERELAFTNRVVPSLERTRAGNILLLEVEDALARRAAAVRDAANEHVAKGGSMAKFGPTKRRIERENPVYTPELRQRIIMVEAARRELERRRKAQTRRAGGG